MLLATAPGEPCCARRASSASRPLDPQPGMDSMFKPMSPQYILKLKKGAALAQVRAECRCWLIRERHRQARCLGASCDSCDSPKGGQFGTSVSCALLCPHQPHLAPGLSLCRSLSCTPGNGVGGRHRGGGVGR